MKNLLEKASIRATNEHGVFSLQIGSVVIETALESYCPSVIKSAPQKRPIVITGHGRTVRNYEITLGRHCATLSYSWGHKGLLETPDTPAVY